MIVLTFPNIDPVAIAIGPLSIHWYGLMYLIGIGAAWFLAGRRLHQFEPSWSKETLSDLVFACALGVILGGRLGYVLFYDLASYINEPMRVLQIWKGGMSFHGGLIGVLLAVIWFSRKHHKTFFQVTDFIAPVVPLGLGTGRIGNFINAELWGKPTDAWYGMIFPTDPSQLARHPSQLYQFALEGVALFLILWIFSRKPRPTMAVSGMFLLFYGIFRFAVEFVRVPDEQLGYLAFDWLTMGQVLCLPMILGGLALITWAYNKRPNTTTFANTQIN